MSRDTDEDFDIRLRDFDDDIPYSLIVVDDLIKTWGSGSLSWYDKNTGVIEFVFEDDYLNQKTTVSIGITVEDVQDVDDNINQ